jgi:hypothetical protein
MGSHTIRYWRIVGLVAAWSLMLCGCDDDPNHNHRSIAPVTGQWDTTYSRDYYYLYARIFDLAYPGEIGPYDSITSIHVYQQESSTRNDSTSEYMYLKTGADTNSLVDEREVLMAEMERDQYELLYGQDMSHCPIALVFYSGRYRAIGVHMVIKRCLSSGAYAGVTDTIGFMSDTAMDTLRIILPLDADNTPDHPSWQLMWRNCYKIPKNINIDMLEVKIFKGVVGHEGSDSCLDYQVQNQVSQDSYLEILGLDQYNENGEKLPDGKIDERVELFRPEWGLLIFPEREPFNSNRCFQNANGEMTDTLALKVPTLYYYQNSTEKLGNSVYYLQIRQWTPDE